MRNHKQRKGFTLIETLLALSVGILIVSASTMLIYTAVQLNLSQQNDTPLSLHTAQVCSFLRTALATRTIDAEESNQQNPTTPSTTPIHSRVTPPLNKTGTPPTNPQTKAPIKAQADKTPAKKTPSKNTIPPTKVGVGKPSNPATNPKTNTAANGLKWEKPEVLTLGSSQLLSFSLKDTPASFSWNSKGSVGGVKCYLYTNGKDGLCILWTPTLASVQLGDKPPIYTTELSPYLRKISFAYYDADTEKWEVEEEAPDTSEKPLPTLLMLEFQDGNETIKETIALQKFNNEPLP